MDSAMKAVIQLGVVSERMLGQATDQLQDEAKKARQAVMVGPRGGRYYMAPSGERVYVDPNGNPLGAREAAQAAAEDTEGVAEQNVQRSKERLAKFEDDLKGITGKLNEALKVLREKTQSETEQELQPIFTTVKKLVEEHGFAVSAVAHESELLGQNKRALQAARAAHEAAAAVPFTGRTAEQVPVPVPGESRPAARPGDTRIPGPGETITRKMRGKPDVVVHVKDNGFEYNGKLYTSLGAISQEISGAYRPLAWWGLDNQPAPSTTPGRLTPAQGGGPTPAPAASASDDDESDDSPAERAVVGAIGLAPLSEIANRVLGIETLETRRSDSLDFHEVATWTVRDSLYEAYSLGVQKNGGTPKPQEAMLPELTKIAKQKLDMPTLKTQRSGADFSEVGVSGVREALMQAAELGLKEAPAPRTQRLTTGNRSNLTLRNLQTDKVAAQEIGEAIGDLIDEFNDIHEDDEWTVPTSRLRDINYDIGTRVPSEGAGREQKTKVEDIIRALVSNGFPASPTGSLMPRNNLQANAVAAQAVGRIHQTHTVASIAEYHLGVDILNESTHNQTAAVNPGDLAAAMYASFEAASETTGGRVSLTPSIKSHLESIARSATYIPSLQANAGRFHLRVGDLKGALDRAAMFGMQESRRQARDSELRRGGPSVSALLAFVDDPKAPVMRTTDATGRRTFSLAGEASKAMHNIQTGKRGGRFYLTKDGKKVYTDKNGNPVSGGDDDGDGGGGGGAPKPEPGKQGQSDKPARDPRLPEIGQTVTVGGKQVKATEGGFEVDGKEYPSMVAATAAIAGRPQPLSQSEYDKAHSPDGDGVGGKTLQAVLDAQDELKAAKEAQKKSDTPETRSAVQRAQDKVISTHDAHLMKHGGPTSESKEKVKGFETELDNLDQLLKKENRRMSSSEYIKLMEKMDGAHVTGNIDKASHDNLKKKLQDLLAASEQRSGQYYFTERPKPAELAAPAAKPEAAAAEAGSAPSKAPPAFKFSKGLPKAPERVPEGAVPTNDQIDAWATFVNDIGSMKYDHVTTNVDYDTADKEFNRLREARLAATKVKLVDHLSAELNDWGIEASAQQIAKVRDELMDRARKQSPSYGYAPDEEEAVLSDYRVLTAISREITPRRGLNGVMEDLKFGSSNIREAMRQARHDYWDRVNSATKSLTSSTDEKGRRVFALGDEANKGQHNLQVGPRGGRYYTTASGEKVYTDQQGNPVSRGTEGGDDVGELKKEFAQLWLKRKRLAQAASRDRTRANQAAYEASNRELEGVRTKLERHGIDTAFGPSQSELNAAERALGPAPAAPPRRPPVTPSPASPAPTPRTSASSQQSAKTPTVELTDDLVRSSSFGKALSAAEGIVLVEPRESQALRHYLDDDDSYNESQRRFEKAYIEPNVEKLKRIAPSGSKITCDEFGIFTIELPGEHAKNKPSKPDVWNAIKEYEQESRGDSRDSGARAAREKLLAALKASGNQHDLSLHAALEHHYAMNRDQMTFYRNAWQQAQWDAERHNPQQTANKAADIEALPDGIALGRDPFEFDPEQLRAGTLVEMEHTSDPEVARGIAMDHLSESPDYYRELAKMEANLEARKGDADEGAPDSAASAPSGDDDAADEYQTPPELEKAENDLQAAAAAGFKSWVAQRDGKPGEGEPWTKPATPNETPWQFVQRAATELQKTPAGQTVEQAYGSGREFMDYIALALRRAGVKTGRSEQQPAEPTAE